MKIAIISDIHDNLENLRIFLAWAGKEEVNRLACLGDVTNSETLKALAEGFAGGIFLVRGNQEIYNEEELKKYDNIIDGGYSSVFTADGASFGICHEPFRAENILEKEKPEIIFYGHTHKPWIEEKGGVKLANPGTLGGVFFRATFAVWDTESGKLELEMLDLV